MFQLGTKAETLELLRAHIRKAKICPSIVFTVDDWNNRSAHWIERIRQEFAGLQIVVRSSALNEDGEFSTNAGRHTSVLDVSADSRQGLEEAVSKVIASYQKTAVEVDSRSQVLVQPMVSEISMSGVIFTQDLNTGGPYYVINYDDVSGKTDAVTSGIGDTSRTLLIHRGNTGNVKSSRFRRLMDAVREIEKLVLSSGLDIEFAVTKSEDVYIFQVRHLAVQENWNREISHHVDISLDQIRVFLNSRFSGAEGVLGSQSVFGVMPDWNPIEMIGSAPRQLALSLYRHLITDSVWAEARAEMGYRDLSGRPLMVNLGGRVYVDVRESFNSFLPGSLPDDIGEKLVTHWLQTLMDHPELHDKVEFDVACTVYPVDFDEKVRPSLERGVLTGKEIDRFADCLLDMTNSIVSGEPDIIKTQLDLIHEMALRRETAFREFPREQGDRPLELSRGLLNDCRVLGTRPFSVLARCAFIGEEFLRSLTRMGLISADFASDFRRSVKTILSDFLKAVGEFHAGRISESEFLEEFGHLRPGTYDILSKRYDQREYFRRAHRQGDSYDPDDGNPEKAMLSRDEEARIDRHLKDKGYHFKCSRLLQFVQQAVAAREYAKFKFTHNLSDALELIARWGAVIGLSRDELSHLSIWDLFNILQETSYARVEDHFRSLAKSGREAYSISRAIRLPFLITSVSDVDVVPLLKCRPNFVTQRCIRGEAFLITGQEMEPTNIDGRIVLIESADPGYDWIFMNRILGLVTKYGGANSHMAIRCAELDIPAAIGCGEQLFDSAARSSELSLDCGAELIIPIN